jgi:hypothetical protein
MTNMTRRIHEENTRGETRRGEICQAKDSYRLGATDKLPAKLLTKLHTPTDIPTDIPVNSEY